MTGSNKQITSAQADKRNPDETLEPVSAGLRQFTHAVILQKTKAQTMTETTVLEKLEPTFTVKDVAEHFNITRAHLRLWVKVGRIEANRVGPRGQYYFTRKQINAARGR